MEIMIKVSEKTADFKHGDVLVYDSRTKQFNAFNVESLITEKLKPFELEKQKFINQMESEKKRYKYMADNFQKMTDEMLLRLGGGKNDV